MISEFKMTSLLIITTLFTYCMSHAIPDRQLEGARVPVQHAHPADIGMYRCMQERIRCFEPLNFLQNALMRMDFSNVEPSQLHNFCSADLEGLKKCYRGVECSIPVPSMERAITMIDWMCTTAERFDESLPCFISDGFKNNTQACKTKSRSGCTNFCPYPYGRLASCLEPYLQSDETCNTEAVSYVVLYLNQLDVPLRRTN